MWPMLVFCRGQCFLSALLLFGLSPVCAGAEPEFGRGNIAAYRYDGATFGAGFHPTIRSDQGRYRGQYPGRGTLGAVPRVSAPWHRLVKPQQAAVPQWSSIPGRGYQPAPSTTAVTTGYRTAPGIYEVPQSVISGTTGYQLGSKGYDTGGVGAVGSSNGMPPDSGSEAGRVGPAPTHYGSADAHFMDYGDYISIPAKPPSGMPKPGVDFIEAPDE